MRSALAIAAALGTFPALLGLLFIVHRAAEALGCF